MTEWEMYFPTSTDKSELGGRTYLQAMFLEICLLGSLGER